MIIRRFSLVLITTLLLGAGAAYLRADEKTDAAAPLNTLTDKEKAEGWRLLFDGKSIDQWRLYDARASIAAHAQPPGEKWKIVDGALSLTPGGGDIITNDQFDSFELVLDYNISRGGNSGVMFHIQEIYPQPGMAGPEIQILDNAEGKDPTKAGWLYGLYVPPTDPNTGKPIDATKPAGQWNHLHILVDGPHVEVEMNGVKYETAEMWSDDWNQRVAKSKFSQWPKFAKARTGHIDLQDHGAAVAFRNIKIRPIAKK